METGSSSRLQPEPVASRLHRHVSLSLILPLAVSLLEAGDMDDAHEVYPNAPLAFVTVEVRFTAENAQNVPPAVYREFQDALGDDWVTEQLTQQTVTVSINPGNPPTPTARTVTAPRFTVRDRTSAVVLTGASVTIETTRYRGWPAFRQILERALRASSQFVKPEGFTRVGMRFVDEIRVDNVGDRAVGWADWLAPDVLAPALDAMTASDWVPEEWNGAARYALGEGKQLVLRYGPQHGYVVNPVGPLRRPNPPPPGPLFLLDFDSFWEPPTIPRFDVEELLVSCDELRAPIRVLFDHLVGAPTGERRLQEGRAVTNLLCQEPTGAATVPTPREIQVSRTRTIEELAQEARALTEDTGHPRNVTTALAPDLGELHGWAFESQLATRTSELATHAPRDLLEEIKERGFGWRDIARMVGVSVPALRRWRQGEPPTGEHRRRIAELAAFLRMIVEDPCVSDIASWMEMPIVREAPVTAIDLYARGHLFVIFQLAGRHIAPEAALDQAEPGWRERYRSEYEVFRAGDGQPAIRPRATNDR